MSSDKNKSGSLSRRNNSTTPASHGDVSGAVLQQETVIRAHMGPIPSADELQKYEIILPGAADRILAMAEKQAAHRQKLEATVVASNVQNSKRGQYFAFVVSMVVIVVGSILIMFDKAGWGLSIILGDLAVLVAVFIGNRVSELRGLSQKRRNGEQNDNMQ